MVSLNIHAAEFLVKHVYKECNMGREPCEHSSSLQSQGVCCDSNPGSHSTNSKNENISNYQIHIHTILNARTLSRTHEIYFMKEFLKMVFKAL